MLANGWGDVTKVTLFDRGPEGIATIRFKDPGVAAKYAAHCHGGEKDFEDNLVFILDIAEGIKEDASQWGEVTKVSPFNRETRGHRDHPIQGSRCRHQVRRPLSRTRGDRGLSMRATVKALFLGILARDKAFRYDTQAEYPASNSSLPATTSTPFRVAQNHLFPAKVIF